MCRGYSAVEEMKVVDGISGKINIKKDEKFNILKNEFLADSKVELRFF